MATANETQGQPAEQASPAATPATPAAPTATPATPAAPTANPAAPTSSDTPTPVPDETQLGDSGKRALDAERAARKAAERQVTELANKVKAFEQAQLSETERLTAQLQEAEATAEKATAEALRLRIANEVQLPPDLQEFLTGTTEEEVRAKAAKLKAATAAQASPRAPAPDPSQGAKPAASGPSQLTRADLARMSPQEIDKAAQEGRLNDLLTGRQT